MDLPSPCFHKMESDSTSRDESPTLLKSTRSNDRSPFHYSPHIGYLSQFTKPEANNSVSVNQSSSSSVTRNRDEKKSTTKSKIMPDDDGYTYSFSDIGKSRSNQSYRKSSRSRSPTDTHKRMTTSMYEDEVSENGNVSAISISSRGSRPSASVKKGNSNKTSQNSLPNRFSSPQRPNRLDMNDASYSAYVKVIYNNNTSSSSPSHFN